MNKLIVKNENDKLLTLESSTTGSLALLKSNGTVLLSVSLDSEGTFHIDLDWTLIKDNKSIIKLPSKLESSTEKGSKLMVSNLEHPTINGKVNVICDQLIESGALSNKPHTMDTSSDLSTKTSSLAGYPTGIKHSEK